MLLPLSLFGCLARSTYPPADESVTLEALGEPAEVLIDGYGVPHVFAADLDDAAAATGWLHARDRGFQLELIRLAARGRLAELFGEDLLPVDRRLRILSYNLEESAANLPEADARRLEAYCAGINAGLRHHEPPLEFKLLRHEPEDWTPADALAVGRLQAWDLSHDAAREALRDRLQAAVDPGAFAFLTAASPALGASILRPDPSAWPALPEELPEPPAGSPLLAAAPAAPSPGPADVQDLDAAGLAAAVAAWAERPRGGSNAWALAPERTMEGTPLLAGDPHLGLGWPATFYELHLHTPQVDVSGASFPGLPMIVIGRANSIAWTLTTSYVDTQDLYRLTVEGTRYEVGGQWREMTPWPQEFRAGGETIRETFYATQRGPLYNPGREGSLREGAIYALSWPGFSAASLPLATAFDALYQATTPAAVVAAVEMLPIPSQNWVYALEAGDIGYVLGGALPSAEASPLPRDGSIEADPGPRLDAQRPQVLNPPSGVIVASNQPLFPEAGRAAAYYGGAWRAMRQQQALASHVRWSAADMRGLQMDAVNLEAAALTPVLLAGARGAPLPAAEAAMARLLGQWDHQMDAASGAPLVYEAWRGALHRAVAAIHIPDPELRRAWLTERLSEAPLLHALLDPAGERWWDDPKTGEVETRQSAIRAALAEAAAELTERYGPDVSAWSWGQAHRLTLAHPFGEKRALRRWFGAEPIPASGGRHATLALDHAGVVGDYATADGPALRQVVAPGGVAGFALPGGNAGQPGHPFARNQLGDWLAGRQHRAGGSAADLRAAGLWGEIRPVPAPVP